MILKEVNLADIKPYNRNPRDNREAVQYVAESIRRFGYRNYIHVDRDLVIICGHTRYQALRQLNYSRATVAIDDDLTPEQVKAFRLADNKVAEYARWKPDLLDLELEELAELDISMLELGFEPVELNVIGNDNSGEDENSYYGDERERTNEAYNLHAYDPDNADGFYNIPHLKRTNHVPERLINFNEILTSSDSKAGVHFFIDDYRFERIWNQPDRYIEILKRFDCAFTPDFSLYRDMPLAMKIWNIYRSRLIGQMCQNAGIIVIPTVSWAEPATFDFCFDGIEPGGTVAVSSVGVMRDPEALEIFKSGMAKMIEVCNPRKIVFYGKPMPELCQGVDFVCFSNENQQRLSNIGRK